MNQFQDILLYIKSIIAAAFSPTIGKAIFVAVYFSYCFLFDVTKSQAYMALIMLIILDFVTSLWAVKISGQPIQSSKIGNSGIKLVAYFMVICGAYLCEKGLASQIAVLDETVLGFFMAREFISLIENVGRMGYAIPQKLLNQLKEFTNNEKSS